MRRVDYVGLSDRQPAGPQDVVVFEAPEWPPESELAGATGVVTAIERCDPVADAFDAFFRWSCMNFMGTGRLGL